MPVKNLPKKLIQNRICKMSLSLEQEAELLSLTEKASDLIVNLIMEEDFNSYDEFQKTTEQISAISPIISKIYLNLYTRLPNIKGRLLDYVRNNF